MAGAPVSQRAQVRTSLIQLLQAMPAIMAEVSKQTGVAVRASVLAYQELTGKALTNRQFAGKVRATRSNFKKPDVTQADVQNSGEKYAMCLA